MNHRENYLKALTFQHPEWIPCTVNLGPGIWKVHREELERLLLDHPLVFPDFEAGQIDFDAQAPAYREGEDYRDNWGCLWHNIQDGMEGQVVEHPIADWSALDSWSPPDPLTKTERGDRDWGQTEAEIAGKKARGELTVGAGERLFDRLYFLRGFDALMEDIATDAPQLPRLIDELRQYELQLVRRWLEIGVDVIGFHTDIGTQKSLMISPTKFRQHIKPLFRDVFAAVREGGAHVTLSSDGCLLEIVDDLVECGVAMHDPQLRANTLEGIARAYKGKMCINLDMDRQMFPFCTPGDIHDQAERAVDMLAEPEGGFMIFASVSGGDVPLANIEAMCEAFEKYCLSPRGSSS